MAVSILHIVGDSKFGGASLGILRLAEHWRQLNWQVHVLATDRHFLAQASDRGIPTVPLEAVWREVRPWRDLQGLIRLYNFLRKNRFSIVHTHTTKAGFIGRIAAWLARTPIVIHTSHGFAFHERSPRWKIAFFVALDRIASMASVKVVTVSKFHSEWGTRLGVAPPSKLVTIPNGIPPPRTIDLHEKRALRQSLGISDSELMLLCHGRLASEKGLDDLLEAFALLGANSSVAQRLVLAGSGPLRDTLEMTANRLGLRDRVSILGFRSDISTLLSAADLVVLPSLREGLSISLLEAMAHGCAIVTTSIGSNREATMNGQCALLVEPGSPSQLASAITKLALDAELRRSLAAKAQSVFKEHYELDRMLRSYQELYQTLLKEGPSAATFPTLLPTADR